MIDVLRINGFHVGAYRSACYRGGKEIAPGRYLVSWENAAHRWKGITLDLGWWRVFVGRACGDEAA